MSYLPAASVAELISGQPRAVQLSGISVLLCRDGDDVFAVENRCSHLEVKLERGMLAGRMLTCLAHGARFDIASGACLGGPTKAPIRTYAVRIENGMVWVDVEQAQAD